MALTQGSPLPNITTNQTQATTAPAWYTDYLSGLASAGNQATQGAEYVGPSYIYRRPELVFLIVIAQISISKGEEV